MTALSTSASVRMRSIRPRATSRWYSPFSGRTSAYCRSTACSARAVPAQAVAVAVSLQQLELGHPVQLVRDSCIGSSASRVEHRLPAGQHVHRLARRRPSRTGPRRTCGPGRGTPICSSTAVSRRPSRSSTRCLQRRVVRDLRAAPCTGRSTRRASSSSQPSSIIASTSDVVPTFRYVEISDEVGVADDDVQPAVLLRVGVRLVAGVDDRALERRLEADLDLEVVGPLAELEPVRRARPGRCRPGPTPRRPAARRRTASGAARSTANGVSRRIR